MSQAEYKRRLKALMLRPENMVCSDCPERQPRWASLIKPPPGAPPGSLAIGTFCCLECSGSHRRLGVHISFVRSINLDQWKEKEVLAMENGGNKKVNALFEARLNVPKPTALATGHVRERFVRDKYERRKYYDPSVFASFAESGSDDCDTESSEDNEDGQRQRVIAGVQRRLATGKVSGAARKRVEERATRKGGGQINPIKAQRPAPAPRPVPTPEVVDLLDFGDFESVEATSAAAAVTSTPTVPRVQPQVHMQHEGGNSGGGPPQHETPENKKMTNNDIMAMFNTPNPQMQQQNLFAMGGGAGMAGSNVPMGNMMMNNPNMGIVSNGMPMINNNAGMMMNGGVIGGNMMMMNNGGVGAGGQYYDDNGSNNTAVKPNPSNMMMMGGGGMNQQVSGQGMSGANSIMMMQQQQQMNVMGGMANTSNNTMMMMQGVGSGGTMQGQFAPMGQGQQGQQQQKQRGGNHIDQFANFGNTR